MGVLADVHDGDLGAAFSALSAERIRAAHESAAAASPRKRKLESIESNILHGDSARANKNRACLMGAAIPVNAS
jgi:hypothetical protein